jgi:hypothetical protein
MTGHTVVLFRESIVTTLYHGCSDEREELQPREGFLYASKNKEAALMQGFIAEMREQFGILGLQCVPEGIEVNLKDEHIPRWGQIKNIEIWLHSIRFELMDGWTKHAQPCPYFTCEWKTTHAIKTNLVDTERFPMGKLLLTKKFIFKTP